MTRHGIVTKASFSDAEELAATLRQEDRRELEDVTGKPAVESLRHAVLMGSPCLALRAHSGDLAGILTVVPVGLLHGVIAFSGTALIEQNRTAFLRGSREVLEALDAEFDTLLNVCDARNEVHVKWLRWLGFTIINRIEEYGEARIPVYEFARIRKQQCATP